MFVKVLLDVVDDLCTTTVGPWSAVKPHHDVYARLAYWPS